MPRTSLPSHLSRCTTYEVLLTKTTEEDLLAHFKSAFETYEARWKPYAEELERCVADAFAHNPYLGRSWRKGGPTRLYPKGHEWNRMDPNNEAEIQKYHWIWEFAFDLHRCMREFNWKEMDQQDEFVSKCLDEIKSGQDELMRYDERNYNNAKRDWETRDADWIAEQTLRRNHENHHSRSWWTDYFQRDAGACEWYKGVIPDNEDTCSFCICEKQIEIKRKEAEAEQKKREEEEARLEAQREAEEKAQRKAKPVTHYHCESCEYNTTSSFNYDVHMKSMEHKLKARFCKACNHQCRTDFEYAAHITSLKHKKAMGEVEEAVEVPVSYHCELCDYTATRKDVFKRHMASKSHLAKSGE